MIYIFDKTNPIFKTSKFNSIFIVLLYTFTIFGVGFVWGLSKASKPPIPEPTISEQIIYFEIPHMEFTPENLKNYINELNIKFPHIVYSQAIQETGYFTSNVFRENNNLFGMKVARLRPTTALGTRRDHAYYKNWMDSVKDYALYQAAYLNHINTEKGYFEHLSRSYAEDPNYIKRLKSIINNGELTYLFNF